MSAAAFARGSTATQLRDRRTIILVRRQSGAHLGCIVDRTGDDHGDDLGDDVGDDVFCPKHLLKIAKYHVVTMVTMFLHLF